MVLVSVDGGADMWQFGEQIHGVVEVVLPILGLVDAGLVGFEELAVGLYVEDGHGEHGHGVVGFGEVGDELDF